MFGCDYQPEKWCLDVLSEGGVYLIFLSMWSVSLRRWCLSQGSISFHVTKESNQEEILSHIRSPTHNFDVILLNYSFIQRRAESLCQVHACNSFNLLKGEFCLLIWQPWKLCWQKRSFQITAHVLVSQQSLLWSTFLRNMYYVLWTRIQSSRPASTFVWSWWSTFYCQKFHPPINLILLHSPSPSSTQGWEYAYALRFHT